MFSKFAKDANGSDLFVEEMSRRLKLNAAYNPVEEEYLDPEEDSDVDYSALKSRHFNPSENFGEGKPVKRIDGLDLDEEDKKSMHEVELDEDSDSTQIKNFKESLYGLSDSDMKKAVNILMEFSNSFKNDSDAEKHNMSFLDELSTNNNEPEEYEEDLSSEASIPLSLSKRKRG